MKDLVGPRERLVTVNPTLRKVHVASFSSHGQTANPLIIADFTASMSCPTPLHIPLSSDHAHLLELQHMLASFPFLNCMFCSLCRTVSASSRSVTHQRQYLAQSLLHSFTPGKRLGQQHQHQRSPSLPSTAYSTSALIARSLTTSVACNAAPPKTVHDIVRRVKKSECACGACNYVLGTAPRLVCPGKQLTCCFRRCHNHLCAERWRWWAEY